MTTITVPQLEATQKAVAAADALLASILELSVVSPVAATKLLHATRAVVDVLGDLAKGDFA